MYIKVKGNEKNTKEGEVTQMLKEILKQKRNYSSFTSNHNNSNVNIIRSKCKYITKWRDI